MNLPETHLNSVVFLCVEEMTDAGMARVPRATGFYVMDRSGPGPHPVWIVTARHCIHELRASGNRGFVRVNTQTGYEDAETSPDDWHESDEHDVAVALLPRVPQGAVLISIPLDQLVDADYRYQGDETMGESLSRLGGQPVRVGHEVFFVGLFSEHAGSERNLPIARFGGIARLPYEPISVRRPDGSAEQIMGYLVEAHSMGGHSGSPVFWCYPVNVLVEIPGPPGSRYEGKTLEIQRQEYLIALLGVVSAHFDIRTPAETTGDVLGSVVTRLNAGIAVVTPAEAIRLLITREDVQSEMAEHRKRATENSEPSATFDVAIDHVEDDIIPGLTRDQFFADLGRVSRQVDEKPPSDLDR